uniref:Ig-like domain-containing protein n=1 Tax=Moschus moschiferus TaxID=68415 RepID=A0A8C6CZ09_MOSMO
CLLLAPVAQVATLIMVMDLLIGGLRAQSVTQPEDQVPVAEGDPVTVKCTYSVSGSPYLFWYVQHRNQGLQFLLKYLTGDTLVKGNYGFEAEFNNSQTSFHLKKSSVLGSDSALYFCAVSDTVVGAAGRAEYKPLSTENHAAEALISFHKVVLWLQDLSFIITKNFLFLVKPQHLFICKNILK